MVLFFNRRNVERLTLRFLPLGTCMRAYPVKSNAAHLVVPRSRLLVALVVCLAIVVHAVLCLPLVTCRSESDLSFFFRSLAPYASYLTAILIPIFDDRRSTLFGACFVWVVGLALVSSVVDANTATARPHPGHSMGIVSLIAQSWDGITFYAAVRIAIFSVALGWLVPPLVKYWAVRRAFSSVGSALWKLQVSLRALLYLSFLVAVVLGLIVWMN